MRNSDPAYLLDMVAAILRWLFMFGFAVSLTGHGGLSSETMITLLVAVLWSVMMSLLALFNRRVFGHRYLTVGGDLIISLVLFFFSGMFAGGVVWAGLLPLITAAMYFSWRGYLAAAFLSLGVQGALAAMFDPDMLVVSASLGGLFILYLSAGAVFSLFGGRLMAHVQHLQRTQLRAHKEAERTERERSRSIYNLISTLNASLNYQRVLETALDLGYRVVGSGAGEEQMVSAVLLYAKDGGNHTQLQVGQARRFTQADLRIILPGREGLVGQAIDKGSSKLGRELAKDPELARIVALRACQSAYCIPLRTGLDTYGVMLFAHPDPDFFIPERREMLDIIGNQAMVAMQNARLYHDLELEKERMIEIQEEARRKLARDLHDGPTQSVAALAMRVNFARRLMDRDSKAASDELYKIEDLARRTTKEIRHMLFTLRPLVLESQGLAAALDSMAEKMRETYNQNVIISADQDVIPQLEMNKQGVIFYLAEEAINNARKHARAGHIWVRLRLAAPDMATLEVEDDGVGFDVQSVGLNYDQRGSLGLVNMRERTELVNGVLQIESEEGKGTRITVLIPLTEDAADRIRRGV